MFQNIAVFDIGSYSIKCIKAKTGFKNFQIESLLIEELDIHIEDRVEQIKASFAKILLQNDFSDYSIITTLPSQKLFFYTLTFPFKNIDQIHDVIKYEVADFIPLELDSVIYDFQPVYSDNNEGLNVLAVVAQKSLISALLELFSSFNLKISFVGTEYNSLLHSYLYFNTVQHESIIQINVGHEKSIVNLIENNNFISTRCIPFGIKNIEYHIGKFLPENTSLHQFFLNNIIDFSSFENNIHHELHKKLQITKQRCKSIFNNLQDEINIFINQIVLLLNAELPKQDNASIQRIIISGGGSLLTGFSTLLSQQLHIPVVMQNIMNHNSQTEVNSQFNIAFGTLINYLNRSKQKTINFLQSEFASALAQKSNKSLFISIFYGSLGILFLVLLIVISLSHHISSTAHYDKIIEERYKRYFASSVMPTDPIKEASNKYMVMKREVESIESFLKIENNMIDILYLLASNFPYDANFDLNNIVINENIIRIDAAINSTAKIDEFKNKLLQTQMFESVVFNTNVTQNNVRFSMTIKFKTDKSKSQTQTTEE